MPFTARQVLGHLLAFYAAEQDWAFDSQEIDTLAGTLLYERSDSDSATNRPENQPTTIATTPKTIALSGS